MKKVVSAMLICVMTLSVLFVPAFAVEQVEALADRILIIKKGKLVCDSTPDDLKKNTAQTKIEESFYTMVGDIDENI